MKKFFLVACFTFLSISFLQAQSNRFTFGLIGSKFSQSSGDHKVSEIKDPSGFGVLVGYNINSMMSLGISNEYLSGDKENNSLVKEKAVRTNLSLFIFPYSYKNVSFYLTAGVVNTIRWSDANTETKHFDLVQSRFGAGIDYTIINGISVAFDGAFYSDGWNYNGLGTSLALRYTLR